MPLAVLYGSSAQAKVSIAVLLLRKAASSLRQCSDNFLILRKHSNMGKGKKGGQVRVLGPNKATKAAMNAMNTNPMEDMMIPPDQMVQLPPPPNRNYQIFWPIRE